MINFRQDIRLWFRRLQRDRGVSLSIVVILTLAIAASCVSFSIVNGVILRPFPYSETNRLVVLWEQNRTKPEARFRSAEANLQDWQERNTVFQGMAAFVPWAVIRNTEDRSVGLDAVEVSPNLFSVLDVPPLLGQIFTEEDAQQQRKVVVISHRFWKDHFGGDPAALGKSLRLRLLSGATDAYTVVGIMPPTFRFPEWSGPHGPDVWGILTLNPASASRRGRFLNVIARLKPQVSQRQAQAQMDAIAGGLESLYPATNADWGIALTPFHDQVYGAVQQNLWLVFAGSIVLLLIGAGNVTSLLAAEGTARGREFAIRVAVGASRRRLVQQILTENVLAWGASAIAALLLTAWTLRYLPEVLQGLGVPRTSHVTIDVTVVAGTLGASLLLALTCGVGLALHSVAPNLCRLLTGDFGADKKGSWAMGLREFFVIGQLALALALLTTAVSLSQSYAQRVGVNLGFRADGVSLADVALPNLKYAEPSRRLWFLNEITEKVRALPGVESVGAIDSLPFVSGVLTNFAEEGSSPMESSPKPAAFVRIMSGSYLSSLKVPLLRGRDFSESDRFGGPRTVLVNHAMVRRYWPGVEPLGKRLILELFGQGPREVVGVVGDTRGYDGAIEPEIYIPFDQSPLTRFFLLVRTSTEDRGLLPNIRTAASVLDPDASVANLATLDNVLSRLVFRPRAQAFLLAAFAGVGLLLAAFGVYSLARYSTGLRRREMGIRMALGAGPFQVRKLIVSKYLLLLLIGCGLGTAAAYVVGKSLSSIIVDLPATSSLTLLATTAFLCIVGLIAAYIPAVRATRFNPSESLREP